MPISEEALTRIQSLCEEHRARLSAPAVSVQITDSNGDSLLKVTRTDGSGSGESLATATRFPIGSLTKGFIAAAILSLRDAEKLSLEDSPAKYLPELRTHRSFDWTARTISDLLSMRSGLCADFYGSWAEQTMALSPEKLKELLQREPRVCQKPPPRYEYSNLSYILLGRIVSEVSLVPVMKFINDKFLAPLQLKETGWSADASEVAVGYERLADGWREEVKVSSCCDAAALGGLISSHRDLGRWAAFIGGESDPTDTVLRTSSRAELIAPKVVRKIELDYKGRPRCSTYGFGFAQIPAGMSWGVGHGGAVPGFGTYFLWLAHHKLSVTAVANLRYAAVNDLCLEIAEILDEEESARNEMPKEVVMRGKDLLVLAYRWDEESAMKLFDPAVWQDVSKEELKTKLTDFVKGKTAISIEAVDSVIGKLVTENNQELSYFLNPFEPGQIQSCEFSS